MEDYRENPNDYLWKALRSDLKQHINKEEIQQHELRLGDTIKVGRVRFCVKEMHGFDENTNRETKIDG